MPNVLQSLDLLLDGYFFNSDYLAIQTDVFFIFVHSSYELRHPIDVIWLNLRRQDLIHFVFFVWL